MTDLGLHGTDFVRMVHSSAASLATNVDYLTSLDSQIGDGDHGINVSTAMKHAVLLVDSLHDPSPADVLRSLSQSFAESMAGAAGGLFGVFFNSAAEAVGGRRIISTALLSDALRVGLAQVMRIGNARIGDKSMVDALAPAVQALEEAAQAGHPVREALAAAAAAGRDGAEGTKRLVARVGRARFVDHSSVVVDPGAMTAALLLEAWADTVADHA